MILSEYELLVKSLVCKDMKSDNGVVFYSYQNNCGWPGLNIKSQFL